MLMKVLMSMFAVLVRAEPGMSMAIKLSLVFEWPIQFRRHLLHGAVMMFVHGVHASCTEFVMQIQSQTKTGIEFRMVSEFEEPNLRSLLPHQFFCLHERVFVQIIDLVENHYVCVFQLLIQDEIYRRGMLRSFGSIDARNRFSALEIAIEELRRVNHREHRIQLKVISDLRPRQRPHHRRRQR